MSLSRLSFNSLRLLLSRLGTQLGLALFTILLARGLGSAGFGTYAFMASVIAIGNVLTTFGTDMLLIREIAVTNDLGQLSPALFIQLALSAVFVGVVLVGTAWLPSPSADAAPALRIYSLSMFPLAFFTVFTTALRGRQRMGAYSLLSVVSVLMQIAAVLWLRRVSGGLITLAVLLLIVQVSAALLAGLLCIFQFPAIKDVVHFSNGQIVPLLRASAPIALLGLLGVIYQRVNLLLLPILAGTTATGWFSAGARIVEAAKIGHVAVFTALYPWMSQTGGGRDSHWSRNLRLPGLLLLLAAALAAILLSVLADPLVRILFGTPYAASTPLVRILVWTLIPYTVNSFLTLAFLARGEEQAIVRVLLLSTVLLVLLTAWWVPLSGASGAAWAALCVETAQSLLLLRADVRRVGVIRGMLVNTARA